MPLLSDLTIYFGEFGRDEVMNTKLPSCLESYIVVIGTVALGSEPVGSNAEYCVMCCLGKLNPLMVKIIFLSQSTYMLSEK